MFKPVRPPSRGFGESGRSSRCAACRKAFGGTVALDGVDLVRAAEVVRARRAERSRCKSTLMAKSCGGLRPRRGAMTLNGALTDPGIRERLASGHRDDYQELSLGAALERNGQIALGFELRRPGCSGRARHRSPRCGPRSARAAHRTARHSDIPLESPVGDLSPASQQLVEIARALAFGCRVLVLDEPTSSLAHDDVQKLFQLILRLKRQGLAIVYISHFIEEVTQVSDRFVVLRDGRNAGEGVTSQTSGDQIVRLMVGRPLDDLYPRGPRSVGDPLLQLDRLAPDRLEPASFTLHRGEILGIAGLLGAGRTRLLRGLFGLDAVKKGSVRLGIHSGPFAPADWWRHGMGMLSEDRTGEGLATNLNIADNMTLTRLEGPGRGFFVSPARQRHSAREWIARLDIRAAGPAQKVSRLSGGNQQKIALARLLHHNVTCWCSTSRRAGSMSRARADLQLIDELVLVRQKAVRSSAENSPSLSRCGDRIAGCRAGGSVITGRVGVDRHAWF